MGLTATNCSELNGIFVRSINTIYRRIRRRLAERYAQISFGRLFGSRLIVRWPAPDTGLARPGWGRQDCLLGLLLRGSSVYTKIVLTDSKAILQAIVREKADLASVFTLTACAAMTA